MLRIWETMDPGGACISADLSCSWSAHLGIDALYSFRDEIGSIECCSNFLSPCTANTDLVAYCISRFRLAGLGG